MNYFICLIDLIFVDEEYIVKFVIFLVFCVFCFCIEILFIMEEKYVYCLVCDLFVYKDVIFNEFKCFFINNVFGIFCVNLGGCL